MRVRTEDKRQEIVAVAAALFEELGYDRASMSLISQRLGGSKATLYGYFKSKEELLLATLDYDISENTERLMNDLLAAPTLREGLIALGRGYMGRLLSSRPISNVRIVSTQPEYSGIGETFYRNILQPAWQRLANRFETMMDDGLLRRADPWLAAMHWKGLVEADLFDRRLLGAVTKPDPREIERYAVAGADAFLQIYGANGQAQAAPPRASGSAATPRKARAAKAARPTAKRPRRRGAARK
jgi:AcrR family transcriptional regulator